MLPKALTRTFKKYVAAPNSRVLAEVQATVSDPKIDFFLEVEIVVERSLLAQFERAGVRCLRIFAGVGLDISRSAWIADSDVIRVFNYWNMGGNATQLFAAELALPDFPACAELDKLISSEVKNIFVPLALESLADAPVVASDPAALSAASATPNEPPEEPRVYLRVVNHVPDENLAEFVARLESSLATFCKMTGWSAGDTFLNLTGRDGTIVQNWIVPERLVSVVGNQLASAPWDELLEGQPQYLVLKPTSFDPVLGASVLSLPL